ncbi:chemotaxis protein CheX [Herbinix hemicellulosilytica]|uniref:Chemotaxis phosphatase CheX-like domain-containing protein n=1 Tax=Herbinix hemicellulosilytica TaxID=1564487 RepID=A0A0H5SGM7_HERHM|nr:chemotaxis protein CheX [Herbinix hemicellulosilytica]RBP59018.1 chemotaxis protein CheX [Herbinix hemicellulosilytica]CRZ33956.1 hypothetical protein HHT355_0753 [Herbinix hemicellulosilytica]
MLDKLYKAFIDATYNVFNLMLNISEISDHPLDEFSCDNGIDIVVEIVGELQGKVIYKFPVDTSLNIVNIMSGMEFDEVDVFVISAVSEIANIISGNVITALSDNELRYDILPPVQGTSDDDKEYEIKTGGCIITPIGEVCLDLRLNRA